MAVAQERFGRHPYLLTEEEIAVLPDVMAYHLRKEDEQRELAKALGPLAGLLK